MIAQAQKDAEKAGERIQAEAEATAERERSRALADIQAAKTAALDEMAQKSVDMAVTLAGRIIQKQLSAKDHAQLINEAIEQFPSRN
jgi:F-type H+-transporting ATPase subunit b